MENDVWTGSCRKPGPQEAPAGPQGPAPLPRFAVHSQGNGVTNSPTSQGRKRRCRDLTRLTLVSQLSVTGGGGRLACAPTQRLHPHAFQMLLILTVSRKKSKKPPP